MQTLKSGLSGEAITPEIARYDVINVGATPKEVAEVIFQMMTYSGVPVTVEGLKVLKEVLAEREGDK